MLMVQGLGPRFPCLAIVADIIAPSQPPTGPGSPCMKQEHLRDAGFALHSQWEAMVLVRMAASTLRKENNWGLASMKRSEAGRSQRPWSLASPHLPYEFMEFCEASFVSLIALGGQSQVGVLRTIWKVPPNLP